MKKLKVGELVSPVCSHVNTPGKTFSANFSQWLVVSKRWRVSRGGGSQLVMGDRATGLHEGDGSRMGYFSNFVY